MGPAGPAGPAGDPEITTLPETRKIAKSRHPRQCIAYAKCNSGQVVVSGGTFTVDDDGDICPSILLFANYPVSSDVWMGGAYRSEGCGNNGPYTVHVKALCADAASLEAQTGVAPAAFDLWAADDLGQ